MNGLLRHWVVTNHFSTLVVWRFPVLSFISTPFPLVTASWEVCYSRCCRGMGREAHGDCVSAWSTSCLVWSLEVLNHLELLQVTLFDFGSTPTPPPGMPVAYKGLEGYPTKNAIILVVTGILDQMRNCMWFAEDGSCCWWYVTLNTIWRSLS